VTAVFADTSFFIAFLCEDDEDHVAAASIISDLGRNIVTTQWVVVEVGNFLCKGSRRSLFSLFVQRLRSNPHVSIRSADDSSFEAGLRLYVGRPDKDWSLTDCISFAAMSELKLHDALTTDHHFVQAGFKALLV